jgi:hypothetical protein
MSPSCIEGVFRLRLGHFRCRRYSRAVFGLVDLLADKRHDVGRTIHAGQARIEDDFSYPRSCLNFDLQYV